MSSSRENLSPQVLQNVARDLRRMVTNPPEGIKIHINEENLTDIQADIEGPIGTPYEGGFFRCKLVLGSEYPTAPPRGFFLTRIFHPNVSLNGDICVNTLKKDWKPDLGMVHIFQIIRCLLIVPFPESALNEDASKLFLDSYEEFAKRARLMTSIHAAKLSKCDNTSSDSVVSSKIVADDAQIVNPCSKTVPAEAKTKAKSRLQRKKSDRKKSLKRL